MQEIHEMTLERAATTVARLMPGLRRDLEDLVRIPSISAEAEHSADLRTSAEAVASLLEQAGARARIIASPGGRPSVLGHREGPAGSPTVLLYAHHDVQPTGPLSGWSTDPFEPVERDGRLYGRGAADDKAGIAVHLAALLSYARELPVNVKVLVEGEEEVGSPTLPALLDSYHDDLEADVLVLADSANWSVGVPALTTSLRGVVGVIVEVRTLQHGIHSGMYGGPIPDALTALCRVLASLHDAHGDVAVHGLMAEEHSPLDLSEDQLRADAGVLSGVRLIGRGTLSSRMATRPAICVTGIDAPATANAANVLVPSARAKVSLRLAPQESASKALVAMTRHLEAHTPWGAEISVTPVSMTDGFRASITRPTADAINSALSDAWGHQAVQLGVGGSIPFVTAFAQAFPDSQMLMTGVEDPDSRAHAADESVHLGEFTRACVAETLLLSRLASLRR